MGDPSSSGDRGIKPQCSQRTEELGAAEALPKMKAVDASSSSISSLPKKKKYSTFHIPKPLLFLWVSLNCKAMPKMKTIPVPKALSVLPVQVKYCHFLPINSPDAEEIQPS